MKTRILEIFSLQFKIFKKNINIMEEYIFKYFEYKLIKLLINLIKKLNLLKLNSLILITTNSAVQNIIKEYNNCKTENQMRSKNLFITNPDCRPRKTLLPNMNL